MPSNFVHLTMLIKKINCWWHELELRYKITVQLSARLLFMNLNISWCPTAFDLQFYSSFSFSSYYFVRKNVPSTWESL